MGFLDAAIAENAASRDAQPTREELAALAAEQTKAISVRATIDFVESLNHGFSIVWNNASGLTPQEVLDAIGTDASDIFNDHAATIGYLASKSASVLALVRMPPEHAKITHNQDGTVTVTFAEDEPLE